MPTFRQRFGTWVAGGPAAQERGLWTRTDGDLTLAGGEGTPYIGSDQWPGVLTRLALNGTNGAATPESLPVTTRATSLITGPLTAAPYKVTDDATGADLPTPRWIADPMLMRPDARLLDGLQAFPHARRLTRSGFWREVVRSAVWYGQGAWVYQVGADGGPVAGTMRQINPATLSITDNSRWQMGVGLDRVTFDRDGYLDLGGVTYRIAVMRNPLSPVGADGLSLGVFGLSPDAFQTAATVDSYTAGTFSSGVPAGYLKVNAPSPTQAQVDNLKTRWMAAHGGERRSIAVLNSTTDFTPLSFSPVDAQAVQIKRMSIGDVAQAFGLPPEALGVSLANSNTYSNQQDSWDRLKAFGLSVWISELEDLLSSLVPYGRSVHVDFSEFMVAATPAQPNPQPQEDTNAPSTDAP